MHLESSILISRKPDEVWRFLADPHNLPKWDRGVAAVELNEATPPGVGFEFTTVGHSSTGPDQGRMTYRVTDVDPNAMDCQAELTSRTANARFVRSAKWRQRVEGAQGGSRVTISVEFRLRLRYFLLGPILLMFGNRAHHRDLLNLKNVLESA